MATGHFKVYRRNANNLRLASLVAARTRCHAEKRSDERSAVAFGNSRWRYFRVGDDSADDLVSVPELYNAQKETGEPSTFFEWGEVMSTRTHGRPQRLIKAVSMCLGYLGFAGLLCWFGLANWEVAKLPRSADPSSGRVYPRGIHGISIYETRSEKRFYERLEFGSFAIFGASFMLMLIYRWRYGPEPNLHPPKDWKPPKPAS